MSPNEQLGYGCIVVIIISMVVLYCAGASTFIIRPMLVERAVVTPTQVVRPTLVPTPTQLPQPTSFIQLPLGTLVATPTQAPLPPRESIIVTPTLDAAGGLTVPPGASPLRPSSVPTATASPTRASPTSTVTPGVSPVHASPSPSPSLTPTRRAITPLPTARP